MTKRVVSIFLSAVMLVCSLSAFSLSANAASYEDQLKAKGFPDTYVAYLSDLHKKYPNWNFEPYQTNINWSDAIAGERSYHSKQRISKSSIYNTGFYCGCSSCYVNGAYKIVEGSTWVAASASAVKYYMDPRTSLDEKYIFQFESTKYDSSQTIEGVEAILASTWMANSVITYADENGNIQTYKDEKGNTVKYSEAIMKTAKDHEMSAYFLASKIVQEVGGSSNTASGASGTVSGYKGIYNYYNIGANTGATAGLSWAATTSFKTSSTSNVNMRKEPNTSSAIVKQLEKSSTIRIVDQTPVQADGYVWYRVSVTVNSIGYQGYIRSDLTTNTYSRPWTNPYLSIYYGAKNIQGVYKNQYTGYLKKFNVTSTNRYTNEYMANAAAASQEAVNVYNAYSKAKQLSNAKTFYIPVFNNMPTAVSPRPTAGCEPIENLNTPTNNPPQIETKISNFKVTGRTATSLSYSWNKVDNATKYQVYFTNVVSKKSYSKEVTTNYVTLNNLSLGCQYTVKVRAYVGAWKEYSEELKNKTLPAKPALLKTNGVYANGALIQWSKVNNADGYVVYRYNANKTYTWIKTIPGVNNTSMTLSRLAGCTNYSFVVVAYVDNVCIGPVSNLVTFRTQVSQVYGLNLKPTSTTIRANWSLINGNADGYQVCFAKDSAFKKKIATKTVGGRNTLTYTGKKLTKGRTYYVKVRAYKKIGKTTYYGAWSSTAKAVCK